MVEVQLYNQNGEVVGKENLPEEIFNVPMVPDLVHQVLVSQMSNKRQGTAHTKTRSEVRGGGRKPWAQKGTGRARHGSIRSPLWRGGGVVFGPRKEKNYKKVIPKKMRRKALFMVLTEKIKKGCLLLLDDLHLKEPKTRLLVQILKKLPVEGSVLIASPSYDKNLLLASRNIPKVRTMEARELNVLDVLSSKYLILPQKAVETIKNTFLKKEKK